jgi:type I restriction enzyme, S subunit
MKKSNNTKIRLIDLCSGKPLYGLNEAATDDITLPRYLRITDINDNGNYVYQGAHVHCENDVYKLKQDDIVFARTGASVGKSYLYNEADGELAFAGFLIKFSIDPKKANSRFISYCCNTKEYWKWVEINCARSGQPGINAEEYSSLSLPYFDFAQKEQQRIAKILAKWDEAIELQERLIEKLEIQKKGFVQKFFKKNTNKFILLSDICTVVKGVQVNNDQLLENGKYYMLNGGIEPSGFLNKWNTSAGTISISEGGESCGFVQYNKQNFWSGGHLYTLQKIKDEIYNKYLYVYLKHNEKKIMAQRVGSGLPNIQLSSLNKFKVNIVSYQNQKYIGDIFFDMEERISLHSLKLELFKKQRKALMQLLLTGTVRV